MTTLVLNHCDSNYRSNIPLTFAVEVQALDTMNVSQLGDLLKQFTEKLQKIQLSSPPQHADGRPGEVLRCNVGANYKQNSSRKNNVMC